MSNTLQTIHQAVVTAWAFAHDAVTVAVLFAYQQFPWIVLGVVALAVLDGANDIIRTRLDYGTWWPCPHITGEEPGRCDCDENDGR